MLSEDTLKPAGDGWHRLHTRPAALRTVVVAALASDAGGAWAVIVRFALLGVPFLAAIVGLDFLETSLRTAHWHDEQVYYRPIIEEFSRELPRVDITNYSSSTTPLFMIVMAFFHRYLSSNIAVLRAINLSFLLASGLVCYAMLARTLKFNSRAATAGCAALVTSPYVFGNSFILVTDTLALLCALSSIHYILRFHQRNDTGDLLVSLMFAMLCAMTRQIYAWLYPATALYLLCARPWRETMAFAPALVMSAVPLLLILLLWGGLTPPRWGYKVSSNAKEALVVVGLGLACVGLYALVLVAPPLLSVSLGNRRPFAVSAPVACLVAIALTALALIIVPMRPYLNSPTFGQAGYLWQVAKLTPVAGGSSLLFWMLVPTGALFICESMSRLGPRHPMFWMFPASMAIGATLSDAFQKYFDSLALIFVLACAGLYGLPNTRLFRYLLMVVVAFGLLYTAISHFYINLPDVPATSVHSH
jgi:hypothetical protein